MKSFVFCIFFAFAASASAEVPDPRDNIKLENVNRVYRYSCQRTFFEGEGVNFDCEPGSPDCVSCVENQRLGLLHARYDFYLYRSDRETLPKFGATFHGAVCGRRSSEFARNNCHVSTPELRFGLYNERAGLFAIPVYLEHVPEGEVTSRLLGFATAVDARGNCPSRSLVKAWRWRAAPVSVEEGSIDGTNPPSNFLNFEGGNLDNWVLDSEKPANFTVVRQANVTPCDRAGNCRGVAFGARAEVQSVEYVQQPQVICVVSKNLFSESNKRGVRK